MNVPVHCFWQITDLGVAGRPGPVRGRARTSRPSGSPTSHGCRTRRR